MKSKKLLPLAAAFAMALAGNAVATEGPSHPQTLNKAGFVGVNKTQSAQSLGHSKLAFYALFDYADGYNTMNGNKVTGVDPGTTNSYGEISKFVGLNAEIGFAVGIWHYFDVGVGIPVYYDQFNLPMCTAEGGCDKDINGAPTYNNDDSRHVGGLGNLHADLKARFPLPEDQPMDLALFLGASFPTADKNTQGVWVRQMENINKASGLAYPFGTTSSSMKFGLAATADFSKLDGGEGFPFLIHVNGGYKYVMNSDLMSYPFISAAAEVYFLNFMSLFVEYYWDWDMDGFQADWSDPNDAQKLDSKQLTGALVFHFPIGMDLHLGASYYLGGDNKVSNVRVWENADRLEGVKLTNARVNPEYTIYGGITWSGFLLPQDRDGDGVNDDEDKCPDDYGHRLNQGCPLGNPDVDEDGVCDSWVAAKGFEAEFEDVCEGVDKCPNEAGDLENDGCPEEELDPDPDEDGICDPWVSQKKLLKKYRDVCDGIDACPTKPGTEENNGCPGDTKLPDPDEDGLCSPWVTDEGALKKFAKVCTGYDACPAEPGHKDNKGCPWEEPDADNDGVCDPSVPANKRGWFEKALNDPEFAKKNFITKGCKGFDKCPDEQGDPSNDGCPLGDADTDGDGLCDEWVSKNKEKKKLYEEEGICHGIDKCPTEAGPEWAQGCPMENPDPDGDSLCSPWVSKKKMLDQFKDICHGVDKCEDEAGPEWNKGCPGDEPDPDADGLCSPWVTKKKMLDQFKDVCKGYDRCEDEAGPEWNNGCPSDDDPDPDQDGVCSEWVTTKKLQKQFAQQCSGIDRCPDEPGNDGHGCPLAPPEKLSGVTFKPGKSTLESNAKSILKGVAEKLTKEDRYKDLKIVIQGHTDNKGSDKANEKLSLERAKAVVNLLVKLGVAKDRIKAVGCGAKAPVADNKTKDGQEENRRIEMHYATPEDDGTACVATYED